MEPDRADLRERLAKVESGLDWIRVFLALLGTVMIGGFALLGTMFTLQINSLNAHISQLDTRIDRLDAKVGAIPQQLSEEFRSMRSELSAQTSAIANAITAARMMELMEPPQSNSTAPPVPPKPVHRKR